MTTRMHNFLDVVVGTRRRPLLSAMLIERLLERQQPKPGKKIHRLTIGTIEYEKD